MTRVIAALTVILFFSSTDNVLACEKTSEHPENHFSHLPDGGRRSLHGMVVFGAGPYFLEHIPMLTPPHDFQILTEVQLLNSKGESVTHDFSQSGFTLKPSATFSLNDFVAGRLRAFAGSIHVGSFEKGGQVVPGLENVSVVVKEYKLIRALPAASTVKEVRVSDGTNVFLSKLIRPDADQQRIQNVTANKELWCVKGPDFFDACD